MIQLCLSYDRHTRRYRPVFLGDARALSYLRCEQKKRTCIKLCQVAAVSTMLQWQHQWQL